MLKWPLVFLLLPLLATAQLKEFEVSEMERADVAVVQANAQFPDDALLLVYSSLKDLNFRSSLGGIDKVSYNPQSNRYEILFKPNKQMLFVYASNFVEQKIETFNPNPKDVFYYKVEEKQQVVVNTKPGTLKIITEPSGADIQLNGIPVSTKTPFTGELNPGSTRIKLQKTKYETIDTLVVVRSGTKSTLSLRLSKEEGFFNITSTPEGAQVFIGGQYKGTTPLRGNMEVGQYEVEVKLDGYTASKQNLSMSKNGSNELSFTMRDQSALPTEIGQFYGGGIVFDIKEDGHGLIVALDDLGELKWEEAKRACESYDDGGYTDWYLPTKHELMMLDRAKEDVNRSLSHAGGTRLDYDYYWSRSEKFTGDAWAFTFYAGYADAHRKGYSASVRAVRAF